MSIHEAFHRVRSEIPEHVAILLACKGRTAAEVLEAVGAGAFMFGQNYVQEAETLAAELGPQSPAIQWRMIGPLQKNKINKALRIFDAIDTIHSAEQARAVGERAAAMGRTVGVMIEVNIADEPAKSGVSPDPDAIVRLGDAILAVPALRLEGLMTLGPPLDDPEGLRPYFRKAKHLHDILITRAPSARHLSMGMSDSYRIAVEEGSTLIRLGTLIFGPRPKRSG